MNPLLKDNLTAVTREQKLVKFFCSNNDSAGSIQICELMEQGLIIDAANSPRCFSPFLFGILEGSKGGVKNADGTFFSPRNRKLSFSGFERK